MRFQSNQSSCGPAALRNALLCIGIKRSEEELEKLTGMTPSDGTSAKGLLKALQAISKEHPEIDPAVIAENKGDIAILRLLEALRSGHPVILVTEGGSHWATAFGILGVAGEKLMIHVADSAEVELVLHFTPQELIKAWKSDEKKAYYGVVV